MNTDPFSLDRLQDIVPGPDVAFWPPAPAWYFVLAVVVIQGALLSIRFARRYRSNAYRRQALRELGDLREGDSWGLSVLLKRVALVAFPREKVASLTGKAWVEFLSQTVSGVTFASNGSSPLESAALRSALPDNNSDLWTQMMHDAERWIRLHKQGDSA